MDWNIINARKAEQSQYDSFQIEFKIQKPKKINRPYELRVKIANLVNKPLMQIMGLTRGLTEMELNGLLTDALAFKENPSARCWNILREIKQNKCQNTNLKTTQKKKTH